MTQYIQSPLFDDDELPPIYTGSSSAKSRNTTGKQVRNAFFEAFERVGGVDHLVSFALDNPTQFYTHLARLIPKEIETNDDNELTVNLVYGKHNNT